MKKSENLQRFFYESCFIRPQYFLYPSKTLATVLLNKLEVYFGKFPSLYISVNFLGGGGLGHSRFLFNCNMYDHSNKEKKNRMGNLDFAASRLVVDVVGGADLGLLLPLQLPCLYLLHPAAWRPHCC
jgi:hypothetical protein